MKLKILCLHGHHQNASRFREKTGSLRKALQSIAEFVFIDSPIQEGDSKTEPCEERQTWFTTTDDNLYKRDYHTDKYNGTFEESSRFVRKFINENGQFDGILAFSQGAAFTYALLRQGNVPNLRFVIFCCGFICTTVPVKQNLVHESPITSIPTFHCINEADQVIPNALSERLAAAFVEPESVIRRYPCGHCIPPPKLCKTDLVEFLSNFVIQEQ